MNFDLKDQEFFKPRENKKNEHGLLAFILALLVVSASVYVLCQNKNGYGGLQPTTGATSIDMQSAQLPQARVLDQQTTYIQLEPAHIKKAKKPIVYKCTRADGGILYSETECSSDSTNKIMRISANTIDSRTFRDKAKQMRAMAVHEDMELSPVNNFGEMPEADVWRRIKELEMDLNSITASQEKIRAASIELNILNNKKVQQLNYDEENERAGLRRLLNSNDINIRTNALNKLIKLLNSYG